MASFAVVTGASSGIGLELARVFARNGYDLLIAAENDELAEAKQEIEALGVEVVAVQADLTTPEGCETVADRVRETGRPVDAAALNAGRAYGGHFTETPL